MKFQKTIKTFIAAALTAILSFSTTSCEDFFDYEGDCDVVHKVRFVYDRNLKWADAFPSEVKSVNLYVYDSQGVFVKKYTGKGNELSNPDYNITLDLPVGSYSLVAWCGLENEGATEESFTVPEPVAGESRIEELTCILNTQNAPVTRADGDDTMPTSDKRLHFLYHGILDITLEDNHDGKEYVYTINLTKDTNHIRIILQELSNDEGLKADDYEISLEAANGLMAYNNELLGNTTIKFKPWDQQSDIIGVGRPEADNNDIRFVKGLVADLSVGRMMASQLNDMMLTIRDAETKETIIARVPIIQYALLSRPYYEMAYGHQMDDQEFLDREDEYVMTFFLYQNRWIDSYIDILQWRIVLHDYDLGWEDR
ncbi:MAG: FimB/Mfa2 family fimbrial subunit [Muribaculaceae bacterium]|nr:FimB/Mfa2 family fimbrial subunit [Muribaculaceae bacterium]